MNLHFLAFGGILTTGSVRFIALRLRIIPCTPLCVVTIASLCVHTTSVFFDTVSPFFIFPNTPTLTIACAFGLEVRVATRFLTTGSLFIHVVFAIILQVPDREGLLQSPERLLSQFDAQGIPSIIATDILSLCINEAPGDWGAQGIEWFDRRWDLQFSGVHHPEVALAVDDTRSHTGRLPALHGINE